MGNRSTTGKSKSHVNDDRRVSDLCVGFDVIFGAQNLANDQW